MVGYRGSELCPQTDFTYKVCDSNLEVIILKRHLSKVNDMQNLGSGSSENANA